MCRQFGAHTCQSNFLPSWSRHPYTCALTGTHCTDADAVLSRGTRFTSNISLQPPASKIEYNLESTWWTMMMQWCTRHQCWWISAPGEVDATTLESMSPPIFTLHPLHDPHFVSSDQPWFVLDLVLHITMELHNSHFDYLWSSSWSASLKASLSSWMNQHPPTLAQPLSVGNLCFLCSPW